MNDYTWAVVQATAEAFDCAGPVVNMGARQYGEQIGRYDFPALFPDRKFIGCDLEDGPGVDRTEDLTKMTFLDGEVGTLLNLHILEHVWDVFAAARETRRVVAANGIAIIVCPFSLHIHRYPRDYWRFTDDTMRKFLEGFSHVIIGRHGYDSMPRDVFGIGLSSSSIPDFDARLKTFQRILKKNGTEPASLWQRFKMRLGYQLISKKHFRDFIHRNETHLDVSCP